ncbi:putative protein tyrosine kinase [Lyophyllum shimeji]|uniref:non-specific serine/threonine protein kinase n=1 Tax=Lyophyllum shimeji TaxID=47721 RepID=A0A9P3PHY7_LYOSH|nr:putative protein tyrosine kinase [Lyophyllum shimeji]
MTSQQDYYAYAQNKGTLVPGQSISVNKFTVQVERYLSQGGFAHVYLVRTATPVYNTTHHVLKRIAVANEAMLTEVKKEVDVMRLLKGHPNIVHLIDAAWHRLPNGTYEVFILMEFCPGGGIIDMMNRRLRERLTEAEILQIFVDVCEGVACMHNLRPALLHRDLKVENILQSSPTSYKLCDFGSATTVSRPPATTQEIRALEADLNRHTTLQYRAPEMVDVYSRRPVDEKSDVWALGVLLYKLCYYTTPFEEHGQLAILNVQYRFPPYPVYSPHMNQLIASMLQEHGVRRPTVFEILAHVHRLRGTKSRFKYNIPAPQPLSPRPQTQFRPSPSPKSTENANALPPSRVPMSVSPSKGQGVQAREKVMEAIAPHRREPTSSSESASASFKKPPDVQNVQPMRRGRPSASVKETEWSAKPSSSQKPPDARAERWLDGFFAGGDASTPVAASSAGVDNGSADVWNIDGKVPQAGAKQDKDLAFCDDFAEKLWDSMGGAKSPSQPLSSSPSSGRRPLTRSPHSVAINARLSPEKDAFEGLGLGVAPEKPAPTLAEARKLRTGLAIMNMNGGGLRTSSDQPGSTVPRLTPSPRQTLPSQAQPYPSSVTLSANLLRANSSEPSRRNTPAHTDGLPAESRFPSLEELDASFSPNMSSNPIASSSSSQGQDKSSPAARRNGVPIRSSVIGNGLLKPDVPSRGLHSREGTRSEQVTGIAMRESRGGNNTHNQSAVPNDTLSLEEVKASSGLHTRDENDASSRPSLTRRHRSSLTMKQPFTSDLSAESSMTSTLSPHTVQTSETPLPAQTKPKDWLTGDDTDDGPLTPLASSSPGETAVLRDSPSKRASVVQMSIVPLQEVVIAQPDHVRHTKRTPSPSPVSASEPQASPTLSRFTRKFPPLDPSEESKRDTSPLKRSLATTPSTARRPNGADSTSSGDEGPEDATGTMRPPLKAPPPQRKSHKGRQSSVHDLVDLYGGGVTLKEKERDTYTDQLSQLESGPSSQSLKGRSAVTPLNSAKSNHNPVSPSSRNLLSPLSFSPSARQPTRNEQGAPASSGRTPSPSPSRSRPQSMFIFPSKSTDSYSSLSAGQPSASPALAPPGGNKPRTGARRTSISDMVQRYEDISAAAKPAGHGRPVSPGVSRPIDKESQPTALPVPGDAGRPPRSPTEAKRTSPGPKISAPIPLQHDTPRKEPVDTIPRNTSLKPEDSRPKFPARKTTDDASPRAESRSSSPERPYQGVGKLIEQWQQKTAEADSRPVPRGRGTFGAKRAVAPQ